MVWRRRVIFTRSSRASSLAEEGARGAAGALACAPPDVPREIASSTSPFSTWPRLPEPSTSPPDRFFSAISFCAEGAAGMRSAPSLSFELPVPGSVVSEPDFAGVAADFWSGASAALP